MSHSETFLDRPSSRKRPSSGAFSEKIYCYPTYRVAVYDFHSSRAQFVRRVTLARRDDDDDHVDLDLPETKRQGGPSGIAGSPNTIPLLTFVFSSSPTTPPVRHRDRHLLHRIISPLFPHPHPLPFSLLTEPAIDYSRRTSKHKTITVMFADRGNDRLE